MKSKVLYLDLDDVLADFYKATRKSSTGRVQEELMWAPKFFYNLEPIPGAIPSVYFLEKMGFDLWILSQPLAGHTDSYKDKAEWVHKYFPSLYKKIILTQNKGLSVGDYLIDDNEKKWKESFENNGGKFVHFPYGEYNGSFAHQHNPEELWKSIVYFFEHETPQKEEK